jgi:hypothetical protein
MGSIIDLSLPGARLPDFLVIDSNLIIAHFLTSLHTPYPETAARASRFFRLLEIDGGIGIVTLSCFNEVLHFAVKAKYRSEIPNYVTNLRIAFPKRVRYDWLDLYKIEPAILQRFHPDLAQLRQLMIAKHLTLIASGR